MSIKYLSIITHYVPDYHYGGVVQSGHHLFQCLMRQASFRISSVSKNPINVQNIIGDYGHCYKSILLHRYGLSLTLLFGLWRDIKQSDIVYIHGLLAFPVSLGMLYAFIQNKPFAIETNGLTEWSASVRKIRKHVFFQCFAFPLMKRAKYVRVTSLAEEQYLHKNGVMNTVMISNGITLDEFKELPVRSKSEKFVFLFLGRIGQEKGLDILIQAYREFCQVYPLRDHELLLVGPDLQNYLKHLAIDYKNESIKYLPGIYGPDKLQLIRDSDVLILPSYSENFGNVVAEALACERPVITTTGTPWREIEKVGCGIYIPPAAEALFSAMEKMYLKSPEEREEMGKKGRAYVFDNFDWEKKAKEIFDHLQA